MGDMDFLLDTSSIPPRMAKQFKNFKLETSYSDYPVNVYTESDFFSHPYSELVVNQTYTLTVFILKD